MKLIDTQLPAGVRGWIKDPHEVSVLAGWWDHQPRGAVSGLVRNLNAEMPRRPLFGASGDLYVTIPLNRQHFQYPTELVVEKIGTRLEQVCTGGTFGHTNRAFGIRDTMFRGFNTEDWLSKMETICETARLRSINLVLDFNKIATIARDDLAYQVAESLGTPVRIRGLTSSNDSWVRWSTDPNVSLSRSVVVYRP